jgi:hypothetical protein
MKIHNALPLFLCLLVFPWSPAESQQDQLIDSIRALYHEALKLENSGDNSFRHEITLNTNYPAIGLQTTVIRFVYLCGQVNPEKDPYLLSRTLKKTVVKYNIAASVNYTIEYLFDESERPVFYYWREEAQDRVSEKRYYLHGGSLIRVIAEYHDTKGNPVNYAKGGGFSVEEKTSAEAAVKRALSYRALFRQIITAETLK